MKKKITPNILLLCLVVCCICISSCKKFIEVEAPPTSINEGNVFESDGTAIAATVDIYVGMSRDLLAGQLSLYPELSADNMTLMNLNLYEQAPYYQNSLAASDRNTIHFWQKIYPHIYKCNAVIKGLNESKGASTIVRQHLLGQAYFLRAFFYFYLTNFYGDVPLALGTDYKVNNALSKISAKDVYNQIISDLKQAQDLLPEHYLKGDMRNTFSPEEAERVTPNKLAATALLARVYLFQKDWQNAEIASSEVINNSELYSAVIELNQVFLKNSKETIWALQPVEIDANAYEADLFVLLPGEPAVSSGRAAYLSDNFIEAFQTGDQRKSEWIGVTVTDNIPYHYPSKYKALSFSGPTSEYSIFLRLGEQYLIRAEARMQQNKINDAVADLNVLRSRATDKNEDDPEKRLQLLSTSLTNDEAFAALRYERRVEMFAEAAYRWLDLKRTGELDAVMEEAMPLKGGTWSTHKALYPIPVDELQANLNLRQNRGY